MKHERWHAVTAAVMANIINYRRFSLHARYPREILEKQGPSVQEAANGRLGLELVTKVRPDCITLDLSMPGIEGQGVLEAIQECGIDVRKIVGSADVTKSTRESCTGFGADAFLNKPPREEELIETVARLVGERADAVS
ncbi:MAG: response regulator [Acidobacteria bacterium]|nr:MAG: response regulator [Acidobacteriota bacterium]